MNSQMYKKRAGTSGIQGQLYESKLISLIYFRLAHDDTVAQFSLATNRDDAGAFDDICFKVKVKGFHKPVIAFIQAKHRENDKLLTFTSKNDLAKYFDSYLKIRRAFSPNSKDMIFKGNFDETECFFVMYTTAKDDPINKLYKGSLAEYLKKLIGTGGCCTQPSYIDEDLDFLCKIVMKEQIITLAEQLAKFIRDESDSKISMNNDLMLRYHVILAHNVLDVSEIQPEGHRIASFRKDFFTTKEEFLVLFKNILCLEVLTKRNSKETDVQSLLTEFLSEPSAITTLSKLMGSVLTYKNDKLEFVSKSMTDDLMRQLDRTNVPQSAVFEAAELAAKDYLLSLKLKVPASFGNKDLAIRGTREKIDQRLNHLTSKIIEILEQSKPNNIVTIDESLGEGLLQLNGGIASAVGNILVYDESSKLLKFTDDCKSLSNLAKTWYEILKSKIENLHEYKLDVKVEKFPKLSFERGEYDVNLVRDFYNKLLFYTNQADQNGVEEILRGEIENHPCNDVNNYRVRSDVIFLKYHDEMQKLWMTPKVGYYLTKKSKIYENAVTSIMSETLMGVLNIMYKITNADYTFNESAIKPFQLHGQLLETVIATGNCVLTVAKVEQYLGKEDHVVLDLEYIFKLPLKSHSTLCKELTNTTKEKILIIVCNNFQDSRNSCVRLKDIAKAVDGKHIIIIANKNTVDIVTENFSKVSNVLNDEGTIFNDISPESQKKLIATSKLKFQDEDLSLNIIVDDESAELIDGDVLNQMINKETIIIGKTVINYNYEKAKPFYIDRRVSRTKKQEHDKFDDVKDKVLQTLYDLEDDVVLITAMPGMGKSTLLTHLSLKTKELDPKVWIVRINLLEHVRIFSKWQNDKIVNTLESLKFMCQAALGEESHGPDEEDEVLMELEESANGTVSLNKYSGSNTTVFQLKLFLHFYNRGKLIFLFDGFDEIFPLYENKALSLLKSVRRYPRKHKIWVTSRSLYKIKYVLEQELGPSYEIEHFNRFEQDTYLNTFWKSKIQLKNLNSEQIQNVHDFVRFMHGPLRHFQPGHFCIHTIFRKIQHKPYLKVYLNFLEHLIKESITTGIDFSYAEYNSFMASIDRHESGITHLVNNFTAPPLHLYLLAECFYNNIKDIAKRDNKWDMDVIGWMFYEYYCEIKLKKIRFEEKNKINIYIPDNNKTYEEERAACMAMHKKLGAFAIFFPYVHLFDSDVMEEIKDMVTKVNDGVEKTGLIRTVIPGGMPLFVHISFAEYFAVEYLCDLIKDKKSEEEQEKLWDFVINFMFRNYKINILDMFSTKIKTDEILNGVVQTNRKIIFKLLYEQKNSVLHVTFWKSTYEYFDGKCREPPFPDYNIHTISLFPILYDCKIIDENSDVDFEKIFFSFFFIVHPNVHDGSLEVKSEPNDVLMVMSCTPVGEYFIPVRCELYLRLGPGADDPALSSEPVICETVAQMPSTSGRAVIRLQGPNQNEAGDLTLFIHVEI